MPTSRIIVTLFAFIATTHFLSAAIKTVDFDEPFQVKPVVYDDHFFILFESGALHNYQLSGTSLWKIPTLFQKVTSFDILFNRLFISHQKGLACYDATYGYKQWSLRQSHFKVLFNYPYIVALSKQHLQLIDFDTGESNWIHEAPSVIDFELGFNNDIIYAISKNKLFSFDLVSGQYTTLKHFSNTLVALSLKGHLLYLKSKKGTTIFDLKTTLLSKPPLPSSPHIYTNRSSIMINPESNRIVSSTLIKNESLWKIDSIPFNNYFYGKSHTLLLQTPSEFKLLDLNSGDILYSISVSPRDIPKPILHYIDLVDYLCLISPHSFVLFLKALSTFE